ncbi:MAG: replication restart helicase PriA [Chloroflexota bacterium]
MPYAEVAVTCRTGLQSGTFSYAVPDHLSLWPGHLVWVPFGLRQVQGVVFALYDEPPSIPTKQIIALAESEPVLLPHQLELAAWVAEHYCCALSAVVKQMLPAEIRRAATALYERAVASPPEVSDPLERAILDALARGPQSAAGLRKATRLPRLNQGLMALLASGLIKQVWSLQPRKVKSKSERLVRLALPAESITAALQTLRRAPARAAALRWLAGRAEGGADVPLAQACQGANAKPSVWQALAAHGYVSIDSRPVWRQPLAPPTGSPLPLPALTREQDAALSAIAVPLQNAQAAAFLLHGVTGSGKGEVYLHALARAIAVGKRAIVLVPEIALTPQTTRRFVDRFGGRVAVFHSRLSPGEHHDEWRRVRAGEVDVVIGSRSAVFAPLPNLGLVIVDEEHEGAYKQSQVVPRYHARDVALKLGQAAGAVVVLGSATPAVETYYRARDTKTLTLLELKSRVQGGRPGEATPSQPPPTIELPRVQVVDMRSQRRLSRNVLSAPLRRAMAEVLRDEGQLILFVNRRGSATSVVCKACGFVASCTRCDVPLVYHSDRGQLLCHQCSRTYPQFLACPQCWSRSLEYQGAGTQRVEAEAHGLFPRARVVRWDSDTTRGKGAHQRILDKFLNREADILVGTQMVAKGLDLPRVSLVGIVAADTALQLPDFRAAERTFQLLTQVSGRAGRSTSAGRVIVQTYSPQHYCLRAARTHDYTGFYRQEIAFRAEHRYPPFLDLAKLVYSASNEARCRREGERLGRILDATIERLGLPDIEVNGPAPAFRRRVRGRYRWQLIVRGQGLAALLRGLPLTPGWAIDIDPISLL